MKSLRLTHIHRGEPFEIEIDGQAIAAYKGETLATVLQASGWRAYDLDEYHHLPGRIYCNMGECQQCLVTVNHQPNTQACKTFVKPGMKVKTRA